ncbi:MAG: hypothetical protein RLO21_05850, partial [Nitratireductor sp.]
MENPPRRKSVVTDPIESAICTFGACKTKPREPFGLAGFCFDIGCGSAQPSIPAGPFPSGSISGQDSPGLLST